MVKLQRLNTQQWMLSGSKARVMKDESRDSGDRRFDYRRCVENLLRMRTYPVYSACA
jgi:hypothetical protein